MNEKDNDKNKKKMNFTRLTNLLFETSSSLVPGTGDLNNTRYTGDSDEEETENKKG